AARATERRGFRRHPLDDPPREYDWSGQDSGKQGESGERRRSPRLLTTQELLHARGDAGGVQAVLGVEALRIAGLAEALHTDPFERRRHHVAQHLGHRATETAVERVVLDRHDVAGLARWAEE